MLVIPVIWFLLEEAYLAALIVFAVAGASDGIDGYLARHYNWHSRLGGWLDPIADKIMQVSAYIMLAYLQLIPVWLLIAVIARDVIIVSGGFVYYFWVEKVSASPSWISKINTVLQILLVVILLIHKALFPLSEAVLDALIYTVLVFTVLSGLDYVVTWSMRAWKVKKTKRTEA